MKCHTSHCLGELNEVRAFQRRSRLDDKQHIRWWKKSKILMALSAKGPGLGGWRGKGGGSHQSQEGETLLNVVQTFLLFFNKIFVMPRPRGWAKTKLWTSKLGGWGGVVASARRKHLKEHHCKPVCINFWCFCPCAPSATRCLTSLEVVTSPLLPGTWASCPCASRGVFLWLGYRNIPSQKQTFLVTAHHLMSLLSRLSLFP